MVAPSASMALILVAGAVSITITEQGTPARRAAKATPWAALPALTVQTPSFSGLRRQPADRVPGAAQLEGADRLQRLELQVDLGPVGRGERQIEADERRADRGVVHVVRRVPD